MNVDFVLMWIKKNAVRLHQRMWRSFYRFTRDPEVLHIQQFRKFMSEDFNLKTTDQPN
jgi:hypothetical protein